MVSNITVIQSWTDESQNIGIDAVLLKSTQKLNDKQ